MPAIGLIDSNMGVGDIGHAVVFGNLQKVNTSVYSINDTVYVASGGGLTGIKPTGANDLIQNMGRVVRVASTTGDILVSAIGRSNDVPNILQARSYLQMPDGMTATGLVKSFNGLTGAVSGVTQINAGTAISVSGTTNPTITNTGVQTWNGLTGAVTGVTTSVANTFTALQTFNAGISAAGATFNGDLYVGNIISNDLVSPKILNINTVGGSQIIMGDEDGVNNNTLIVLNDFLGIISLTSNVGGINLSGPTIVSVTDPDTNVPLTLSSIGGSIQNTLEIIDDNQVGESAKRITVSSTGDMVIKGSLEVDTILTLPNGQGITCAVTGFNGATGNVTGVTGVAAGTGISISGTTRPTITNTGVQSWNGLTGAVTGVTTSVANTFTALQTFNSGISAAGGVTLNGIRIANGNGITFDNTIIGADTTGTALTVGTSNFLAGPRTGIALTGEVS